MPRDLTALSEVMDAAIGELQEGFLTPEQIESSRTIMGIDTQLVRDGTYLVVECDGRIAGLVLGAVAVTLIVAG